MANAVDSSRSRFWGRTQGKLILILLIALVPTLLIQAYVFRKWYQSCFQNELQANLQIARAVTKAFEAFVMDVSHQEYAIGRALTLRDMTPEERRRFIDDQMTTRPYFLNLLWVSPEGIVLASHLRQVEGLGMTDRQYFQEIVAGREWTVGNLMKAKATGEPAFAVARGIRDDGGNLLGIVVASIRSKDLGVVLAIERPNGGGHAIVDRSGMLVYRYPSIKTTWEQRNWLRDYPEFGEALNGKEVVGKVFAPFEGKDRLVAFTPIASIGWAASSGRTEEIAMAVIVSQLFPHVVLLFAVVSAAFGSALLLSHYISSSVTRLRNHAMALGSGENIGPLAASGPTELRELAVSINEMADELHSRQMGLREQQELLRVTLNSIGDAVLAADVAGNITFLNPVAVAITGWAMEDAAGRPVQSIFQIIDEETREPAEDIVERVLRDRCIVNLANHTTLIARDGREIPIEDSAAPITDRGGDTIGVVLVFHDVTEKRRTQEALSDVNRRLSVILESIADGFYALDSEFRFTHINDTALRYFNRDRDEMLGKHIFDVFPKFQCSAFDVGFRRAMKSGEPEHIEVPSIAVDRTVEIHAYPSSDHLTVLFRDVTERKYAEEQLQLSEARFRLLSESASKLLASENPQKVVNELCQGVMTFLDCQVFFNFLVEENVGKLRLNAYAGIPDKEARKIEWLDFGVAVCGCVARDGERMIAEDIFNKPDIRTDLVKSHGIQAYACHPLKIGGQVIGTLSLGAAKRPFFLPDELELMKTVADQVAVAMERTRLIESLRKSANELETRVHERTRAFQSLSECNQAMLRETDEMELFRQVCRIVVDVGGYRMAWVGLAEDDEEKMVRPVASAGYDDGYLDQARISWADNERGRGPTGKAIRNGELIASQNALLNPAYEPWRSEGTRRGYAASIALPIKIDNRVIGTLTIYASEPDAFDQEESSLLTKLADNLSFGVGAIRLTEQRRQSEEELRVYASRLETTNAELQEFAFVASHDLQEPLRKIQTFCDLASKNCSCGLGGKTKDYLERVANSASRMRQLLHDLLEFSRIASRAQPFTKINLTATVREAADVFESTVTETGCMIKLHELPSIEANQSQMLHLFQNLIGNSLKYRNDTVPHIEISGKIRNDHCEIIVEDNGIGFEQQYSELIFKSFQRLHKSHEYSGTGMGLTICRKIIERHGGAIRADGEPGKGAVFTIRLPLKQASTM